jgi:hypothetical protein
MTMKLSTPKELDDAVARLFNTSSSCSIQVCEETAFAGNNWFDLGKISIKCASHGPEELRAAVRRGGFSWAVPIVEDATQQLSELLGTAPLQGAQAEKAAGKVCRVMDSIATCSVRLGLTHPIFDPHALDQMPFRRPVTIVSDTSGTVQGGLSFVAQYLHPAARVKIPAIVHMEIVNFAERFFTNRRSSKPRRVDLLTDHVKSQAGQRILLKLELHSHTEVERTFLLGDPLRNAFQRDNDGELNELNLSGIIGAYADRLILEAARHHQAQVSPGHPVYLLTSDQGLARMALAEGLAPIFFKSIVASDFFGRQLAGSVLHPFTGELQTIPMTSVLWELATAFGSARLINQAGDAHVTVAAIGGDLSWAPYQSHADLLWTDSASVVEWPAPAPPPPRYDDMDTVSAASISPEPSVPSGAFASQSSRPKKTAQKRERAGKAAAVSTPRQSGGPPLQRFNIDKLFKLVDALDDQQAMTEDEVIKLVGARNAAGIEEYRRFLISASAVLAEAGEWRATDTTTQLAIALRSEDIPAVRYILGSAPSYAAIEQSMRDVPVGQPWDPTPFKRAATTYTSLADVTLLGCPIAGEGFYPTPNSPSVDEFASIALRRFNEIASGDQLAATGAWLEALVKSDGIHPEVARARLNDASARGLLRRLTEGSTTEVRFDNHAFQALRVRQGAPVVETVHLYRGDYLIPGKSSTSLRIEDVKP